MIEHHPHRPFPHFRGIPRSCVHRSILSKDGASGKHGVVQSVVGDFFGVHIPLNQAYKIMNLEGDSESLGKDPVHPRVRERSCAWCGVPGGGKSGSDGLFLVGGRAKPGCRVAVRS